MSLVGKLKGVHSIFRKWKKDTVNGMVPLMKLFPNQCLPIGMSECRDYGYNLSVIHFLIFLASSLAPPGDQNDLALYRPLQNILAVI